MLQTTVNCSLQVSEHVLLNYLMYLHQPNYQLLKCFHCKEKIRISIHQVQKGPIKSPYTKGSIIFEFEFVDNFTFGTMILAKGLQFNIHLQTQEIVHKAYVLPMLFMSNLGANSSLHHAMSFTLLPVRSLGGPLHTRPKQAYQIYQTNSKGQDL